MSCLEDMTEGEMMKACSPLYPSFAIESAASIVLGIMFIYLWVKISTRSELKAPFKAIFRLTRYSLANSAAELYAHVRTWPLMNEATLVERFTLQRRLSQVVLLFRGFLAFVSVTRWLHVNNVNGFRWLAYACTCPIMQFQLVLMIAPVIPFYRIVGSVTLMVTFGMLITGYVANLQPEHFLNCSLYQIFEWDEVCFDWTLKFKLVLVAGSILSFLNFVQIPILGLIYLCHGGGSNENLPHGYLKLLGIVIITWWCFPVWWFFSYEGIGYFQDTKFNSVGFAVLNLVSKGAMAFHIQSMSLQHSIEAASAGDTAVARELGFYRERSGSVSSLMSASTASDQPSEVRAALSVTSWLVRFLRNFDDGAPQQVILPPGLPGMQQPGMQESTSDMSSKAENEEMLRGQLWDGLEPMYKRFLHGAGVSKETFEKLSATEKVTLREKFDKVTSAFGVSAKTKPDWIGSENAALERATDRELLAELRRRLEGQLGMHTEVEATLFASAGKTAFAVSDQRTKEHEMLEVAEYNENAERDECGISGVRRNFAV